MKQGKTKGLLSVELLMVQATLIFLDRSQSQIQPPVSVFLVADMSALLEAVTNRRSWETSRTEEFLKPSNIN